MKIMGNILITCCILFSFSTLLGQENDRDIAPFEVYLSTDKQRYSDIEGINLKVSVKNISKNTAVFYMYEDKSGRPPYTTFQPRLYDMDGKEIENLTDYKLKDKYTVDIIDAMDKRPIPLGGGEIFTYTIDLTSIYRMYNGNFYRVRCYFVPDFSRRHVIHGKNEITFLVDGPRDKNLIPERPAASRNLTPSEAVLLTLEAEKNSEKDKMLKYIDLEEFIKTESNFIRSYAAAGEFERKEILEQFKWYLLRQRRDYLIKYKIIDEGIDNDDAYVDVLAERYSPRRNDSYKYRYILRKNHETAGIAWLIIGLEASIFKGTINE